MTTTNPHEKTADVLAHVDGEASTYPEETMNHLNTALEKLIVTAVIAEVTDDMTFQDTPTCLAELSLGRLERVAALLKWPFPDFMRELGSEFVMVREVAEAEELLDQLDVTNLT